MRIAGTSKRCWMRWISSQQASAGAKEAMIPSRSGFNDPAKCRISMSEQSESRPSRTPRQTVAAALERILTEIPPENWQLAVADAILLALGEWSELPESTRNLLALPVTINAGEKSDATHSTSVQRR